MRENKIDFAIGGQAVIEGVMMRSPGFVVVSVRKESGKIKEKKDTFVSITKRIKILAIPVLRGIVNFVEMLILGYKALDFSANESVEENPKNKEDKTRGEKLQDITLAVFSIIFALALGLFLFKFVPLSFAEFLSHHVKIISENYIIYNLVDGITKMLIFVLYIFLISLIPIFKRVFEYHGAEHKAVFAYEKNLALTISNVKKQSRFHPRCGTSFIFVVFTISILIYTMFPKLPNFYENLTIRIALLPLIAGIGYELLKFSAKYAKRWWVKIFIWPGLMFQRITTKEPDEKQLEVSINSLQKALKAEKNNQK